MVWPSKKIIIILGATTIALAAIIFANFYSYSPQKPLDKAIAEVSPTAIQNQLLSKDTDNDGLKDWEEALWHSDIKKTDTDGDGTNDNDEVKAERDPTIKGPNDSLKNSSTKPLATKSATSTNLTETERAAQDLFITYMELKKSGIEITPDIQASIANKLITTSQYSSSLARTYSSADVRIVSDSSLAIVNYGNYMGISLEKNAPPQGTEGELEIMDRVINNQDTAALQKLAIIHESYKKIISAFLKAQVPRGAVSLHIALLNDFSKIVDSVEKFQKFNTDPILILTALKQYEEGTINLIKSLKEAHRFFTVNNIIYTEEDDGYGFANVLNQ